MRPWSHTQRTERASDVVAAIKKNYTSFIYRTELLFPGVWTVVVARLRLCQRNRGANETPLAPHVLVLDG
jgi:hypothetical protein